jgi:hypothetical protein
MSEVNRILGKVDELAASDEEINTPFMWENQLKLWMVRLTALRDY